MHSLVVTKTNGCYTPEEIFKDMYIHSDGEWIIRLERYLEFPRYPFNVLTTMAEKFCYATAEFCGALESEAADAKFEELSQIVMDFLPSVKKITLPTQDKTFYYDSETGAEVPWERVLDLDNDKEEAFYKDDEGMIRTARVELREIPYYGFVDHQSWGKLRSFLEEEHVTLKDFLTRREYWVVIDGDEYFTWEKFKENGVINTANILREY